MDERRTRFPPKRRFTLVDVMLLVATVGVALVPIRALWLTVSFTMLPLDHGDAAEWYALVGVLRTVLRPLVVAASAALWLAALRRPRRSIRRLCRQPGMAATTAILATSLMSVAQVLAGLLHDFLLDGDYFSEGWISFLIRLEALDPGKAVLAVWMVLWLGRTWRAERSWIDRAGRALGCYCLIETISISVYIF